MKIVWKENTSDCEKEVLQRKLMRKRSIAKEDEVELIYKQMFFSCFTKLRLWTKYQCGQVQDPGRELGQGYHDSCNDMAFSWPTPKGGQIEVASRYG